MRVKFIRKRYYNMTFMCVSAVVAQAVGERKGLRLSAGQLHHKGGSRIVVARLKERSGELGRLLVVSLYSVW